MRRVLVVEDDLFISTIFKMFLHELGHELVGLCQNGREAIQMCHELKPDVVLMDIHLQGEMDGIQTAEKLKTELDIPVIYVSGDTSKEIIERAVGSNSYGFLVKPVNKKELGISINLAYFKHKVDLEQKKRERGYREFISESPVPNIIVKGGKILYLNKLALDRVMKTTYIEDVMGLEFESFVDDEYKDKVKGLLGGNGLQENRFVDEYIRLKDLHGAILHIEISGSLVRFNDEMAMQIIVRDITPAILNRRLVHFYQSELVKSNDLYIMLDRGFKLITKSNTADSLIDELKAFSVGDQVAFLKKTLVKNLKSMRFNEWSAITLDLESTTIELKVYPICEGSSSACQWILTKN